MDAPNDAAKPTSFAPLKAILKFKKGIKKPENTDSLMERGEAANIDPVANSNSTDRNSDSSASNSDATVELPNHNSETPGEYSIESPSASPSASSWGINVCLAARPDLSLSYEQRLYQHGHQKIPNAQPVVHFEALEGTNILFLEQQLMSFQNSLNSMHMLGARVDMYQLGTILHRYSDAIRDAEYMRDHLSGPMFSNMEELGRNSLAFSEIPYASNCSPSKFIKKTTPITYETLSLWLLRRLSKLAPSEEGDSRLNDLENKLGFSRREKFPRLEGVARFIIAVCGGLMLIVPMLIMRIHGDLARSLVTTSISVFLFAATISVVFKATDVNTLAATAAYTAVLVVFVGTNN